MIRVCFITYWFPPDLGACPNRIYDFSSLLQNYGVHTCVITRRVRNETVKLPVHTYKISFFAIMNIINMIKIAFILRKEKINSIFATIPPIDTGLIGFILGKLLNIPILLDIRDPWIHVAIHNGRISEPSLKAKIGRYIEKILYKYSDCIIVNSPGVEEIVVSSYKTAKVHFLPNGFNEELFSNNATTNLKEKLGVASKKLFVYLGQFGPAHGTDMFFDCLLENYNFLSRNQIHFLFICFETKEFNEFKDKCKSSELKSIVGFHEPVPRSQIPEIVKSSDVGMASLKKGFEYAIPSKIFDHLGCGKPVLVKATKEAAVSKLIRKYNVGSSFYDEEEFKESVEYILKNYEILQKNTTEIIKDFNREKVVKDLYMLLEEVTHEQ